MAKIHVKRLEKLAAHLESKVDAKYQEGWKKYLEWAKENHIPPRNRTLRSEFHYDQHKYEHEDEVVIEHCGSPACAFGEYAAITPQRFTFAKEYIGVTIPSLQHREFLKDRGYQIVDGVVQVDFSTREYCDIRQIQMDEFNLTSEETDTLFDYGGMGGRKNSEAGSQVLT